MSNRPIAPLLLLLSMCCSGCGLLWVPSIEKFPSPIRQVQVRDAQTGTVLSSASVEFRIIGGTSKASLFGRPLAFNRGAASLLPVVRSRDGSFIPRSIFRLAFWQDLWPLFSWATDGDWEYYGHMNQIVVASPAYETVWIEYPANSTARSLGTVDGTLTVNLKKP